MSIILTTKKQHEDNKKVLKNVQYSIFLQVVFKIMFYEFSEIRKLNLVL